MLRRLTLSLIAGLFAVSAFGADLARDLARIHTEMIGGLEAVQALGALKATGRTRVQGLLELQFVMWAARPNLIRTESTTGGRVLTQGYDGVNPPWRHDSETGRVRRMGPVEGSEFKVDAAFDDPLTIQDGKRVSLDYAGEIVIDGRRALKILVTVNFTETSFVYLDAETFMLVRRDLTRRRPGGVTQVQTYYSDFRIVAGVSLPHHIIAWAGSKVLHETWLETIEANPTLAPGLFAQPPDATAK